jgi:hypothetical protein
MLTIYMEIYIWVIGNSIKYSKSLTLLPFIQILILAQVIDSLHNLHGEIILIIMYFLKTGSWVVHDLLLLPSRYTIVVLLLLINHFARLHLDQIIFMTI